MATILKNLGQRKPAAGNGWEPLYTVPTATGAVCSNFCAYNQSAVADTIRVSIRVAGVLDSVQQRREYDMPVPGNDAQPLTLFTANAGDIVQVASLNGTTSFSADGSETSQ